MTRAWRITIACLLSLSMVFSASGCQRKVEVKTGTRVVCTQGELISENVRLVKVPASEAAKYSVKTITRTCSRHEQMAELYASAQTAIGAGDLKTAAEKLAAVVKADAGYRSASQQLDAIKHGKTPSRDTDGTSTPAPKPGTTKPGEGTLGGALVGWIPDTITGYRAAKPVTDPMSVSREYVPQNIPTALMLVVTADQYRTAKQATTMLGAQIKSAYEHDAGGVQLPGRRAYYGTDGQRYAVIAFTDGPVLIACAIAARPGTAPDSLKAQLIAAAKQLP